MSVAIARPPGRIVTFYSYKGGTGRSMAVANIAWLMAAARKRVLIMDWDLEAPGIHRYFHPFLVDREMCATRGVIDLLSDYADRPILEDESSGADTEWWSDLLDVSRYSVPVAFDGFPQGGSIDLMPAGRQGSGYARLVSSFDWDTFYDRLGGGAFLDALREALRARYDYVLIDSRTGVSDTAGICTVQLPDELVVLFTYNNQSIRGAAAVAQSARGSHRALPGREYSSALRIFPVPSRADPFETRKLQRRQEVARALFDPFLDHLSPHERGRYWNEVEIPYSPFLSYEEVLSPLVFDPDDPKLPVACTLRLCRHITSGEVDRYSLSIDAARLQELTSAFEWTESDDRCPVPPSSTDSAAQGAESARAPSEVDVLIRAAEALLVRLDEEELADARRLLLKLVRHARPRETPGLKSLRVPLERLLPDEDNLIGRFVQAGVLQISEDAARERQVAVASEGLLSHWGRLNAWAEREREVLELRDRVQTTFSVLEQSGQLHEQTTLLAPVAEEALRLIAKRGEYFSDEEKAFVRNSTMPLRTPASAPAPPARRPRWGIRVAAVAVLLLSAVGAGLFVLSGPGDTSPPRLPLSVASPVPRAESFAEVAREDLVEGRLDSAVKNLTRAIDLDPQNVNLYLERSEAYRRQGDQKGALDDVERARARSPDSASVQLAAAALSAEQGRLDAAILEYSKVLDRPDVEPELQAQARRALGRLEPVSRPAGVVHLYVASESDLDFALSLQRRLRQQGIQASAPRLRSGSSRTAVLLVGAGKDRWAGRVRDSVTAALAEAGYTDEVRVRGTQPPDPAAPDRPIAKPSAAQPGVIEVWLPELVRRPATPELRPDVRPPSKGK